MTRRCGRRRRTLRPSGRRGHHRHHGRLRDGGRDAHRRRSAVPPGRESLLPSRCPGRSKRGAVETALDPLRKRRQIPRSPTRACLKSPSARSPSDTASGMLRDGAEIRLRPQALQALEVLLQRIPGGRSRLEADDRGGLEGHARVEAHRGRDRRRGARRRSASPGRWITHRPKAGYRLEVPTSDELVRKGSHFVQSPDARRCGTARSSVSSTPRPSVPATRAPTKGCRPAT